MKRKAENISRPTPGRRLALTTLVIALAGGGTLALVDAAHAAGFGNGSAGNTHGGPGGNMQGGPGGGRGGPGGQGQQDGQPSPENMQARLAQELGLTDAQAAQVKQILESARAKHRAIHEETKEALSKILTPEQLQKLESHMRRGPGGRGGNMQGGPGGMPGGPGGGGQRGGFGGGPGGGGPGGGGPGGNMPDDDNPPE